MFAFYITLSLLSAGANGNQFHDNCRPEIANSYLKIIINFNGMLLYFDLLVSDSDVQDFVLKLGPVDELLARPVRHISQNVDVQLEFSLRKLKHVVCFCFLVEKLLQF